MATSMERVEISVDGVEPGAVYVLRSRINCRFHGHVDLIHVISKYAGGEIRGYMRGVGSGEAWRLRRPATPVAWPEIDRAVAAALGEQIQPVTEEAA